MLETTGTPVRIDTTWFRTRYGQNFPDLLTDENQNMLENAIDDVYTLFHGVSELWSHLERDVYERKTQMCYGLLTAWYITDVFPDMCVGVMTTGGIPLREKRIGGTVIKFSEAKATKGSVNNADLLGALKSNAFGAKAYMMIKASGKLNTYIYV